VIEIVDEVTGPRRADAGASVGTYLALAALNRLVDPCSRRSLADWWTTTAADRFTGIRAGVLDHRRFWDATRTITTAHLAEIERRIVAQMIAAFGLDISAVALPGRREEPPLPAPTVPYVSLSTHTAPTTQSAGTPWPIASA
jgi:hypothetical protein